MEEKKSLRREIRLRKALLLNEQARKQWSARVWEKVAELEEFKAAGTVLLYCSLPDEVDTGSFIKEILPFKKVVVPLVEGDRLLLKRYVPGKLHPGYKGIPEPDADAPQLSPSEIDFAVIPGMAFDMKGHRMGRGGGFYDKLLPSLTCFKTGVAYSFQICETIPSEAWDIPVDMVITD